MHHFKFIICTIFTICALAIPTPNLLARQTLDSSSGYSYALASILFCQDNGGSGDNCVNMNVPAIPLSGGGAAVDTIMNPAIEINYREIPSLDGISAITVTGSGILCAFSSQVQSRNPYNICGPQIFMVNDGEGQVNLDPNSSLNDNVRCVYCIAPVSTSSK